MVLVGAERFFTVTLVLGAHPSSSRSNRPLADGASERSSSFILLVLVKIVEVVKHEIHVLLLLTLQVVDNPLIFVNFDSYVSISLSRDGSRFDQLVLIDVVISLSCGNFWAEWSARVHLLLLSSV